MNDRDIIVIKGGKLAYVDTGGLVPDNLIPEIKIGSIAAELEEIAGSFPQFKCREAVAAMQTHLDKKKKKYSVIMLGPEDKTEAGITTIMSKTHPDLVSNNGEHFGLEYNGRTYCNFVVSGMKTQAWINNFEGIQRIEGGIKYVKLVATKVEI